MKLGALLDGIPVLTGDWDRDLEISGISYDTRSLTPGSLFVALSGYRTDGHRFMEEALQKGAAAVLCLRKPKAAGPYLTVADTRAALARVSANWFGHPADGMTLLGVTGTNGKTTSTYLIKAVLEETLGAKVGLMGTNQNMIGSEALPAKRTTPESYEVQRLLRDMADAGCSHVVMEVSSHALVLGRVNELNFAAGVFTNLTQDHLDFHGSMEEYRRAKGLLFARSRVAVLNLDDEAGRYYAETVPCKTFTYSENKDAADLTAKNLRLFPNQVAFEAVTMDGIARVMLPIPGGFSVYNALGAIAACLTLGIGLQAIANALAGAKGVKGRLEVLPVPAEFTVMVDYAHTPDALENILTTLRDFTPGRVLCLFGCGGDRDRSKRALMGGIALDLSDFVVITSDNPRTEPPEDIIADILTGLGESETPYRVIPDRRAAIRFALTQAKPGDTLLLAGKGHETYQEIAGLQQPFDEREEVRAYFAAS
ncbi:MAG: UDP-N-acetylmuramoyl-L-alanyl-D-glutamate--2,6-diaminopimelate ligase, partial [Pseudoflavonifractor sp.]